jgi:hypothetical protein
MGFEVDSSLPVVVANNPLSYTDPSGECWWCTLLGVGLDIAGFFTGGTSTILGTILTTAGTVATGGSIGGGIIGDISGGVNSSPWNEQIPIGSIGGSLNTGGTFGSGNTDPFVFSLQPSDKGVVDYNVENFIAGLPDSLSFGWTRNTRTKRGLQQADFCSGAYQAGEWAPIALGGLRLLADFTDSYKSRDRFIFIVVFDGMRLPSISLPLPNALPIFDNSRGLLAVATFAGPVIASLLE